MNKLKLPGRLCWQSNISGDDQEAWVEGGDSALQGRLDLQQRQDCHILYFSFRIPAPLIATPTSGFQEAGSDRRLPGFKTVTVT